MFSKSSKKKKNGFECEDKNKANFEKNRLTLEGDKITVSPFCDFSDFQIDELDQIGAFNGLDSPLQNISVKEEDTGSENEHDWGVEIHEIDDVYDYREEKELESEDLELFNC